VDEHEKNVFGWLDYIRARPGMFLPNRSLHELEILVLGYYSGLGVHGIVESVPQMYSHFVSWLVWRTDWACSRGWAFAIVQHYPVPEKALAAFFRFIDEYRRLKPTTLCTVRLGPSHNPTGKRMCIGLNGRVEKPLRVDVVRYNPEPLHFLRFHYPDRVANQHILMTGEGTHTTTVRYAKQWVRDEFQVPYGLWKPMPKSRSQLSRTK
jgi:hypothetical protein